MNRAVLDSSAVLAMLHHEPGEDIVWPLAPEALISAVNASEVHAKLISRGFTRGDAWDAVLGSVRTIVAFDEDQAENTGSLATATRAYGLSLGDRACLALGLAAGLPIYTADQMWNKLRIGADIRVIR